jgi:acyl-CoA synthetase (AMP-forming)/AMP-acid ligase II
MDFYNALEIYRSDPRLAALIGPGGPFETEDVVLAGIPLRSFVRAPRTILDAFQMGRAHAQRTHVVLGEERHSFADIRGQALSVAHALKVRYGVTRGDRVAIAMRNLPEFVVAFWSAAALGAIAVPLNAWWTGPELAYALCDSGPRIVFADPERLERLAGESLDTGLGRIGVRTGGKAAHASATFEELASGPALDEGELAALGPDDPVTILYTSGTTGRPRGALGTNRATLANLMNMAFASARNQLLSGAAPPREAAQPASIAAAPLFHIGGIAAIVGGPMSGSKIVLMHRWTLAEALPLAERERVTSFGGVPTIARQILESPDLSKYDLGSVRGFPLGGAAVPPDLPKRALEIFGSSLQILNGYGSTETTSAVVTNVGVEYAQHLDSVGRPNLTADLRVEGPDGRLLAPGEVGELCFRSPQVVKGYWNDPEATRQAFVDGFFHTGDLGYVDTDGFVYVVDRLKDVVIRGGENVYCAEVEAALFEHPAIADVAVVGLPERHMGERVCAAVVLRPGAELGLAQLRAFASARLAAFKCPEALFLTPELPKTATGKTAKRQLREAIAGAEGQVERDW